MIIDTHAHYDDKAFDNDRHELLTSLEKSGIAAVVNVAADMKSLEDVPRLAHEYNFVYGAIGLHPDNVGALDDGVMDKMRHLLEDPKMVAVGEIGLDYHWNVEPKDVQMEAFARQIELAKEAGKPIMVHSREAANDTMQVIKDTRAYDAGGIIHCYAYSPEMAREYVKMGFYLGIGGTVTFKNARKIKEVVAEIPLESLVLETDCPYLAPEPNRGKRNSSLNLPYVAAKIAKIKGCRKEEVEEITYNNAKKLLGL